MATNKDFVVKNGLQVGGNTVIDGTLTVQGEQIANTVTANTINRDPNITVNLTGDVTGSGNTTLTNLANGTINIATTVGGDTVALGTDTTGNYVATVTGTNNQIEVSGSGSETAAVTLSLPTDVTIDGVFTSANISVTHIESTNASIDDLSVTSNADITGTLSTNKITVAANSEFGAGIYIGADEDILLSESPTNALNLRVGTTGAYKNFSFEADGDLSAPGAITATGNLTANNLTLTSDDDLTFTQTTGDWSIRNAQQGNKVVIYDGTAGVQLVYGDTGTALTVLSDGATIDGNYILTTADEGTGNGIDADTVDGKHATDFTLDYVTDNNANTTNAIQVGAITATDATLTGDVQIDGDLTVSGNTVTVSATELAIDDNMIYLNANSAVTNPDLGFAGSYNDGTYAHAGLFRDASDGWFKFFDSYTPEPDASIYIDTTHATFALADLEVAKIKTSQTSDFNGQVNLNGVVRFNPAGYNFEIDSDTNGRVIFAFNQSSTRYWTLNDTTTNDLNFARAAGSGEFQVQGSRVLTTADEGTGNGLDADTVDGLQASQFLRSDANDTTSGSLTVQGGITVSQTAPKISLYDTNNSYGGGAQHAIEFATTGGVQGFIGVPGTGNNAIFINNKNGSANATTTLINSAGGGIYLETDGDGYLNNNRILTVNDEADIQQGYSSTQLSSSDNLDSLSDGWYKWASSSPTNAPTTYMTMLQATDPNQKIQLAFGQSQVGALYVRRADGGSFYTWTEFARANANNTMSGVNTFSANNIFNGTTSFNEFVYLNRDVAFDSNGYAFLIDSDGSRGNLQWTRNGSTHWNLVHDSNGNLDFQNQTTGRAIKITGSTSSAYQLFDVNNRVSIRGDGVINWGNAADQGRLTWGTGQARVRGLSGQSLALGANNTDGYIVIATDGTTDFTGQIRAAISGSDEKIVLRGTTDPYIQFQENTTDKFQLGWNSTTNTARIYNQQTGQFLVVGGTANTDPASFIIRTENQAQSSPGDIYATLQFSVQNASGVTASGLAGTSAETIAMIAAQDFRNSTGKTNEDSGLGFYTADSGGAITYRGGVSNHGTWILGRDGAPTNENSATAHSLYVTGSMGDGTPLVHFDADYTNDGSYSGDGSILNLSTTRGDGFSDGYLLNVTNSDGTALKVRGDRVTVLSPGTTDYLGNQAGVVHKTLQIHDEYDGVGTHWTAYANLDGNFIDSTAGADTQHGWIFGHGNSVRGGMIYDHRGTERMAIWSSYGPIDFMSPDSVDGNGVPIDSNINERMRVEVGGDITFFGVDGGTGNNGNLQRIQSAYFVNNEDDNISTTLSEGGDGARLYFDHNFYGDQTAFSNIFSGDGGGFAYYGGDQLDWTAIYDTENTQYAKGTWRQLVVSGSTTDVTGSLYVRNTAGTGNTIARFVGGQDTLDIVEVSGGDYAIRNSGQNNGITIFDGSGGTDINYNGSPIATFANPITFTSKLIITAGDDDAASPNPGLQVDNGTIYLPHDEAHIIFDEGQKMITTNDGQGNFNIVAGSDDDAVHVDTTSGTSGLVRIQMDTDGQAGEVNIGVGPRRSAGSAANYTHGLRITDHSGLQYITGSSTSVSGLTTTRTVWHSGNDGSGSGLDADTVDGIQGADFFRSDTGDTYSGGHGAVYFESNNLDNQSGAGFTIRTSSNPSSGAANTAGAIFAVRSSGQGLRLHVGQSLTSTGDNDFETKDCTADAFYYASDERLKENIITIETATEVIKQLRGVKYDWIESGEAGCGLIAQEVEKIVPEVVSTKHHSDIKTVNYGHLVGHLVEGFKEQQELIESQQKQIDELKEMVEKLLKG